VEVETIVFVSYSFVYRLGAGQEGPGIRTPLAPFSYTMRSMQIRGENLTPAIKHHR